MKDYVVYLFTLIIGVSIFYVFNAIETQSVMLEVTEDTREIIEMMTNMLSGVSIFVAFVLGFLIIYANQFLMKRRNKEFGLYLLMGMGKRRISIVLFLETLIVGIISLIAGLLSGIGISQLMSIFVADMFEADMSRFEFVISDSACKKTIICFAVMYLFVMIFNVVIIGKCKLIDLLQAEKRTETVKMKNPWVCAIVFLVAVGALSYAYSMVVEGTKNFSSMDEIFIPIILGAAATFLIFWSLSGLTLKIVTSIKCVYYRGLNSFILRQLSSKINTMVISVTVICLMLFATICILSSALSIKNSMNANLNELAPADIELVKRMNMSDSWMDQGYNETQIDNSKLDIAEIYQQNGTDITEYLQDYVVINIYRTEELTMKDSLGMVFEDVQRQFSMLDYDTLENCVTISEYNKLAKLYGHKTYTLLEDEYIILADFTPMIEIRNTALEAGQKIMIGGHVLKPKYAECQEGFISISSNHTNIGIFIVPDSVVEDKNAVEQCLIGTYDALNKEEKNQIEEAIKNLTIEDENYIYPVINSKLEIAEVSTGLGALVTFIGLYLGIVFLISCAAILALKEMSESADNRERYYMLRKLGVDEKMIHRALFRQIGSFFLIPLILAVIHSIFGLQFCRAILETFGDEQLWISTLMTGGLIVIIYGGYFGITYFFSKNIIREG